MCIALLRVSYKNDKQIEHLVVENESDLEAKVAELQTREQVMKIAVFRRVYDVRRHEEWKVDQHLETTAVAEDV